MRSYSRLDGNDSEMEGQGANRVETRTVFCRRPGLYTPRSRREIWFVKHRLWPRLDGASCLAVPSVDE